MTPVNATTHAVENAPRREPVSAKVIRPSTEAAELAWMLRGSQEDTREPVYEEDEEDAELTAELARVVPAQAAPVAGPLLPALDVEEPVAQKRDWSSALDLVQEACEAIRISEERVQELERQGQQAMLQTREDIKALQLQIQAGERRAQAAEARASRAEARALEAESWLARLHDAITMGFGRMPKSGDL